MYLSILFVSDRYDFSPCAILFRKVTVLFILSITLSNFSKLNLKLLHNSLRTFLFDFVSIFFEFNSTIRKSNESKGFQAIFFVLNGTVACLLLLLISFTYPAIYLESLKSPTT
jgi:hypothetical protein